MPNFVQLHAAIQNIADDATIPADLRARMVAPLRAAIPPAPPDAWIYRLVVISLGAVAFATVAGAIAISIATGGKGLPDGIIAIASAAVGALAGLLAPAPN
jgi:hypothetical protein